MEINETSCPGPIMVAHDLKKSYVRHRRLGGAPVRINALDGVSLEIRRGSTLALVGESGAGKSTLARILARLEDPDSGRILFEGKEISRLKGKRLNPFRRRIQMVFQDPAAALNPRFSAGEIVEEPLEVQGIGSRKDRRLRALALMEQVELPAVWASRHPDEMSAGQKQRLAIARGLALEPVFLILDEALRNLDLSIQAQLANLLLDLQASRSLTYLYISHDLGLVSRFADDVAVMYQGKIVEKAPSSDLFVHPRHPYTQALLRAMPTGKIPPQISQIT